MKSGMRVRMMDLGGQQITGTVIKAGVAQETPTLNPVESEVIETVVVQWDDPARGTDRVAAVGLEVLDS